MLQELPTATRTTIANSLMDGYLPYEAVKKLRTLVGREISDSTIASDVPKSKWKALYGALSDDLGAAAQNAGPEAVQTWKRANNYTRAGMERIENTLNSVIGDKKTFEDIFKGVAPTNVDSVNKIRRVFRSLDDDQRQIVSDAIVNRMGRATPGQQDATGDKFSSETFLTNWNRINDSAKSQLFPDSAMRSKLDAIAKVSEDIRAGKVVFGNPSGTGQAMTAGSVYAAVPAAVGMAATGNVGAAAATLTIAGSMVASANIGAKMLTSPKVVDWLAKSAKVSTPEQMTAQLGRLGVIFNETKDQALKAELSAYINSVNKKP
jgi:hypothetical protein